MSFVDIGECTFLPTQSKSLLTLGSEVYLKSGSVSVNEQATYPDVYNGFKTFSPNYINWDRVTSQSSDVQKFFFVNGIYFRYSYDTYLSRSTDGVNWTHVLTPLENGNPENDTFPVETIVYGEGMYVIAGNKYIYTSPNLITWTLRRTNPSQRITKLAYSSVGTTSKFVAACENGLILYSLDGLTWSSSQAADTKFNFTDIVFGVTSNVNSVVAVGSAFNISPGTITAVFTSGNGGSSWASYNFPNTNGSATNTITSIVYSLTDNLYVMTNGNGIFTMLGSFGTPTLVSYTGVNTSYGGLIVLPNTYLMLTAERSLYMTVNGSWIPVTTNIPSGASTGNKPNSFVKGDDRFLISYGGNNIYAQALNNQLIGILSPVSESISNDTTLYMRIK